MVSTPASNVSCSSTRIVTTFLLFVCINWAVFTGASAENTNVGAKIQQAAAHIAESHQLLDQLVEAEETATGVRIDCVTGRLQKNFQALGREIKTLNKAKHWEGNKIDPLYDHEDELLDNSLRESLNNLDDNEYRRHIFFALGESCKKAEMNSDLWQTFTYWSLHIYFSCV